MIAASLSLPTPPLSLSLSLSVSLCLSLSLSVSLALSIYLSFLARNGEYPPRLRVARRFITAYLRILP